MSLQRIGVFHTPLYISYAAGHDVVGRHALALEDRFVVLTTTSLSRVEPVQSPGLGPHQQGWAYPENGLKLPGGSHDRAYFRRN
jgi:hypothetical protein